MKTVSKVASPFDPSGARTSTTRCGSMRAGYDSTVVEKKAPVMSMRVDGPATWRNSIPSTNSAATISIAGEATDLREHHRFAAGPDCAHCQRVGIEREEVGACAGCDTSVVGRADRARRVARRTPHRGRGRESERGHALHGVGHRDGGAHERAVGKVRGTVARLG